MTEQQYEKLKANKHVYDFYQRVFTINTASPEISAINEVIIEKGGQGMNLSCSGCVIDGLKSIYNEFERYQKENNLS